MCKKAEPNEFSEVPKEYTNPPMFDAVNYMRRRVDDKIDKYSKRGFSYRRWYLVMTSAATALAAAVPVLINLDVGTMAPTILSLMVTILVGLEGIFHFREQWRNYDLLKSRLREERWLYMTRSGDYVGKNDQEAFQFFVKIVEGDIARERLETIGLRTNPNGNGSGSPRNGSKSEGNQKPAGE